MLAAMPAIISHNPNTVLALLGIGHPSDTTPNTRRYLKNLQNIINNVKVCFYYVDVIEITNFNVLRH